MKINHNPPKIPQKNSKNSIYSFSASNLHQIFLDLRQALCRRSVFYCLILKHILATAARSSRIIRFHPAPHSVRVCAFIFQICDTHIRIKGCEWKARICVQRQKHPTLLQTLLLPPQSRLPWIFFLFARAAPLCISHRPHSITMSVCCLRPNQRSIPGTSSASICDIAVWEFAGQETTRRIDKFARLLGGRENDGPTCPTLPQWFVCVFSQLARIQKWRLAKSAAEKRWASSFHNTLVVHMKWDFRA
jgi:hypothetical protein